MFPHDHPYSFSQLLDLSTEDKNGLLLDAGFVKHWGKENNCGSKDPLTRNSYRDATKDFVQGCAKDSNKETADFVFQASRYVFCCCSECNQFCFAIGFVGTLGFAVKRKTDIFPAMK